MYRKTGLVETLFHATAKRPWGRKKLRRHYLKNQVRWSHGYYCTWIGSHRLPVVCHGSRYSLITRKNLSGRRGDPLVLLDIGLVIYLHSCISRAYMPDILFLLLQSPAYYNANLPQPLPKTMCATPSSQVRAFANVIFIIPHLSSGT